MLRRGLADAIAPDCKRRSGVPTCASSSIAPVCKRSGLSARYLDFSGPETSKRKRVTRKADGKLTLLVKLGGSGTKADAFAYPFQLTPF